MSARCTTVVAVCATLLMLSLSATAREKSQPTRQFIPSNSTGSTVNLDSPHAVEALQATAQGATTWLAYFDFEGLGGSCDPQGWTSADITAQEGLYAHVDDFAGLGPAFYPLEGNQSLWMGARADAGSPVLCGYAALPGYGNSWDQGFCTTACLNVVGNVTLDYLITYWTEPGYDFVDIEYDLCDDNYVSMRNFSGDFPLEFLSDVVPDTVHTGQVGFRFHFTSDGAWSDQDGLWDTDGAFTMDSVTVSDATGTILGTELFETETPGDQVTTSGAWQACASAGYGDFSALYKGFEVLQEDPCSSNLTCMWVFYDGSSDNYGCGGYPGQTAVPYENARGQYMSNEVWSPYIPISGSGTQYEFTFDVYRGLALNALIFYVWHIRSVVGSCPGRWADRNFVFFGDQKDWLRVVSPVGDLVEAGATHLQLALGTVDMCRVWCGNFGTGDCHSQAPMFDNVSLYRIDTSGPQWSVRDINMFQDNFAEDGTTTGTGRADAAIDILPGGNLNIVPGDSAVVVVADPDNGLAADAYTGFGPAVYAYVGVWPQGQPGKGGGALTQDSFRWPVVDSLNSGGDTWYCLRVDTAFTIGATRTGAPPDAFCVDLNDNLFTPGDTICFFFCAESDVTGDRTYFADGTGSTTDLVEAIANPSEFQILPGGGWAAGGDILYVDGMSGRGAQPFFDTAFQGLGIYNLVDRYDVRGPSSSVANRPGARVKNVFQQIIGCYRKIIWNTGDLNDGLIGDGTGNPEKSDDAGMLFAFLENLPNTGGVYFSGDNIAEEWVGLGGAAISLKNYITHNLVNDSHVNAGYGTSPYAIATLGSCFDHSPVAVDTLVAYGGCALINDFDVLEPTGAATLEMTYNGSGSSTAGAVIGQKTLNNAGFNVGVILSGFSYHYIRDDRPAGNVIGLMDRVEHLYDILQWLGNTPPFPVDVPDIAGSRYNLEQNYPNPFNPTTTIKYEVKETGNVTLRIYNVAGQLVRTLVNGSKDAGVTHVAEWNGRNDAGVAVSSGVYFYKLTASNWTQTKKMVLLK